MIEKRDADTGALLATTRLARLHEVKTMLEAKQDDNGRSAWTWFVLPNGDLIFGCYPHGETYERLTQLAPNGPACPIPREDGEEGPIVDLPVTDADGNTPPVPLHLEPGDVRTFRYHRDFQLYPELRPYSGKCVRILRMDDPGNNTGSAWSANYTVRAADGFEFSAARDELEPGNFPAWNDPK